MSMPAPVSPVVASIPIPPPADDMGSHSSSSSSSFVSWCESEHGSLPTTHQLILDTAKQHGCNDDAAPNPTTSTPPATKVGLQTSVGVLQQFYGSGLKGRRVGKVKTHTPRKATAQLHVVTDDEDNDEENDEENEEFEDEEDSYSSSSDESVPEIVTIPASADREDEDLSSIFDMSLAEMFSDGEEGELEVEEDEKGRDEYDAAEYGPGIKAVLKNGDQRDAVFNETPVQKVTQFELPSSTSDNPKKKKKGVSFSGIGEGSGGKAKNLGDIPESEARSNRMRGKGETGNKTKKRRSRSRYISSASSTRAVIQSFMSHTRASMAKTRRSLSKSSKSSTTKATGTKPAAGTKTAAKRDDKNADADDEEQTDSNVADAVVRAKQRIRQHRHKQRASV